MRFDKKRELRRCKINGGFAVVTFGLFHVIIEIFYYNFKENDAYTI